MTNDQIMDLLVARAQQEQLAAFYIVQNHPHLPGHEIDRWMNQLLCRLLQAEQRKSAEELTAQRDVDTLLLHSEDKQYKAQEVEAILKQLQYASFTGKHRYWIIQEAHKCTAPICNKLLKTLEGPPADTTIFLLNPNPSPLLPTVLGRAVVLRLNLPQHYAPPDAQGRSFSQFLQQHFAELAKLWEQQLSVGELAQKIHAAQARERFTQAALLWSQAQLTQYQQCQDFLDLVQFLEQQREFHGRPQTQLAVMIRHLARLKFLSAYA